MFELMVIGRPEGADSLFSKVEKMIKDANASNLSSSKMGKKPLAYAIKKQNEGEYFLFNFDVEGEAVKSMNDFLRLEQESILRYMIVTVKAKRQKSKTKEAKGAKETKETEEAKEEVKIAKPKVEKAAKKADTKGKTKSKAAKVEKK